MSSSEIKVKVGNNLKKILDEKGMSQAELARLTDIPKSAITQYVKGMFLPKMPNMSKIAAALGVNVGDILGSVDVFDYLDTDSTKKEDLFLSSDYSEPDFTTEKLIGLTTRALEPSGYFLGETTDGMVPIYQLLSRGENLKIKKIATVNQNIVAMSYLVYGKQNFSAENMFKIIGLLNDQIPDFKTLENNQKMIIDKILLDLIRLIELCDSTYLPDPLKGNKMLEILQTIIGTTRINRITD